MYVHRENTRYLRRQEEGVGPFKLQLGSCESCGSVLGIESGSSRRKLVFLPPRATSLAPRHVSPPSITPSIFQNHCLRTVILKCDPDGLLCETLSCGLQGQNFDSRILFALPPTLSEMPCSFPEAV